MDLRPGVVIGERYRIERVLAADEGGTLLETREAFNGLLVAVKVVTTSAPHAKLISRFARAQKIDTPHAPKLFELGGTDDGRSFIALEYLTGTTVAARVAQGPLPVGMAVDFGLQACHALAAAHEAGVVHRTLKTSKLVEARRSAGGTEIKVLGFATTPSAIEPASGDVPAGVEYLAPEQLDGIVNGDRLSDVWTMGVILYELLTGRLPFTALTRKAIARNVARDDPKPPRSLRSELSWQLEQAILRCLDKTPATRTPSIGALVEALAPFASANGSAEMVKGALASAARTDPAPAHRSGPPGRTTTSAIPTAVGPLDAGDLPNVAKLNHLQPANDGSSTEEPVPAFHRLRSDGQIERMEADDMVVMARARRVAEESARLKQSVGQQGALSLPPARGASIAPRASAAPAVRSGAPPAEARPPTPSAAVGLSSTSRLVVVLILAAVFIGLGTGLLVRFVFL